MSRALRVDDTQAEVVKALERVGCLVWPIGQPFDLLVSRAGVLYLIETKTAKVYERKTKRGFRQEIKRGTLTGGQEQSMRDGWPVTVCWSADNALRAVGLVGGTSVRLAWLKPGDTVSVKTFTKDLRLK